MGFLIRTIKSDKTLPLNALEGHGNETWCVSWEQAMARSLALVCEGYRVIIEQEGDARSDLPFDNDDLDKPSIPAHEYLKLTRGL